MAIHIFYYGCRVVTITFSVMGVFVFHFQIVHGYFQVINSVATQMNPIPFLFVGPDVACMGDSIIG